MKMEEFNFLSALKDLVHRNCKSIFVTFRVGEKKSPMPKKEFEERKTRIGVGAQFL